jgi:hypothetical protein
MDTYITEPMTYQLDSNLTIGHPQTTLARVQTIQNDSISGTTLFGSKQIKNSIRSKFSQQDLFKEMSNDIT